MEFKQVHSDTRRTIWANDEMLADKKEISFILLHPEKSIGGCLHDKDEYVCVLEGNILCKIGENFIGLNKGESKLIPANQPHMFITLDGALLMEWGVTAEDKQLGNKYKSRSQIDLMNQINNGNYQ